VKNSINCALRQILLATSNADKMRSTHSMHAGGEEYGYVSKFWTDCNLKGRWYLQDPHVDNIQNNNNNNNNKRGNVRIT